MNRTRLPALLTGLAACAAMLPALTVSAQSEQSSPGQSSVGQSALDQSSVGQTAPDRSPPAAAPGEVLEELTVRGRRPEDLRLAIEQAEDRLFEVFNAINSTDDFDIRCKLETRAGTKMLSRVCLPNFAREMRSESAKATLAATGAGIAQSRDPQSPLAGSQHRQRLLVDEMSRLARENDELLRAMIALYEINAEANPERFAQPGRDD